MFLAKASSSFMPGRGLINPAFVIKIVPATDDLQPPRFLGRPNPSDDWMDNLKTGEEVVAKIGKRNITGKVRMLLKNAIGDLAYVKIEDSQGKIHKVQSNLIKRTVPGDFKSPYGELVSSPAIFGESKFLSFSDYHNLNG
jgi:hypothetical protein